MSQDLKQRRYDHQLSQLKNHVAVVMYQVRSFTTPPNIKSIERLAKAERRKVALDFRPSFDDLLQKELGEYVKRFFNS